MLFRMDAKDQTLNPTRCSNHIKNIGSSKNEICLFYSHGDETTRPRVTVRSANS